MARGTMYALTRLGRRARMTSKAIRVQHDSSDAAKDMEWLTTAARPENSDDVPYPMTKDEALIFTESILNIPDPEASIAVDRMKFLNLITERMHEHTPFTDMCLYRSTPVWEMEARRFTEEILLGKGGLCWATTPFMKALLEHYGYKTYHISGRPQGFKFFDFHISTIVEDAVHSGSLHLVDTGLMRDIFTAVPLDFETESPEYKFHHSTMKFFREGDKVIAYSQVPAVESDDRDVKYDSNGKHWKQQLVYLLNEKRNWYPYFMCIMEFYKMTLTTGGQLLPPFHGLVFCTHLFEEEAVLNVLAFQDRIDVYRFYQDGTIQKTNMSKASLLRFFKERFTQYSESELREVFERCPFH